MKKCQEVLLLSIAAMSAGLIHTSTTHANECNQDFNQEVTWTLNKIETSELSSSVELDCKERAEVSRYKGDDFEVTTGRKDGRYVICASDSRANPCKVVIGVISEGQDPTKALGDIFGATREQPTVLNETVERLYLKPSRIIR